MGGFTMLLHSIPQCEYGILVTHVIRFVALLVYNAHDLVIRIVAARTCLHLPLPVDARSSL